MIKTAPERSYYTFNEAKDILADILAGNFPERWKWTKDKRVVTELAVGDINPVDIPSLIQSLHDFPSDGDKIFLIWSLLLSLGRKDPAAAFSLIENVPDLESRRNLVQNVLPDLAIRDPQGALSLLLKLSSSDADWGYESVFRGMTKNNPSEAATMALNLPTGTNRDDALMAVGRAWADTDPQAAANWAQGLSPENASVLGSVAARIASTNPQLAASYMDEITDASTRSDAIQAIAGEWATQPVGNIKDPNAALAWLNQVADGVTYAKAVNDIITSLSNPGYEILQNKVDYTEGSGGPGYSGQDIPTAISLLGNVTDPAVRETAITTIAGNWGKTDPGAALAWVQTQTDSDGTVNATAVDSIVANWSKNDPAAAFAYVQNSADPSVFLTVAPALAPAWAAADPQAALTWTGSLPDGVTKNQALNNVLVSIAKSDFTTAWIDAAALPAADNPVGIMTNLVGTLASKDPSQAAGLIVQFPAGTAQDNVMATVAATWVKQDPQAFTVWLTSLPPGDVRDTAIAQLVSSAQATKNPAGVLEWVNTVIDPQIKAILLQKLTPAQSDVSQNTTP